MLSKTKKNYDLKTASALLNGAATRLSEHKWFAEDWLFSVHPFPPAPEDPQSITLHVFRSGWFNDDRQGIHFETFLGPKEWQKRQIPIMMHIFHCPLIPGTTIKRRDVSKPFIDAVFDQVSSWSGYKFRAGQYGTHPFTCTLQFEFDTLESQIEGEFSRLCLQLGPIMDQTLASVLRRA